MLSVALAVSLVAAPGLQLDVIGHPYGCRLYRYLPASLSHLVPGLPVGQPEQAGDLTLAVAPIAGAIRVRLLDDDGRTLLRRDLPVRTDVCQPTADVVALVIERYVRDLGIVGEVEALPRTPAVAAAAEQRAAEPDWRAALEGGMEIGTAPAMTRESVGVAAYLGTGAWRGLLRVRGHSPVERTVERDAQELGSLRVRGVEALLGGGHCAFSEEHAICAELSGGAEWLFGSARGGSIFHRHAEVVIQPIAGIGLRYEYAIVLLSTTVAVGGDLLFRHGRPGFTVEGADTPNGLSWFSGRLSLGVAWGSGSS
jgi:hypothetical protein